MFLGCIMGLKIALFLMTLLTADAAPPVNQVYFGDNAELPCHFENYSNTSLRELVIFCQSQQKKVLFEFFKGGEKKDNVDTEYLNRTSFDPDSCTLWLHNVEVKDEGSYHCYIHQYQNQILAPKYQMNFYLSVFANFSQPKMLVSNETENSDIINITCSSNQGYPEPTRMWFVVTTENSTKNHSADMKKYQDNVTQLYNVSASWTFPVPPGANNISISCALQSETTLFSAPYFIGKKQSPEPPSVPNSNLWLVAIGVAVFTVLLMMIFLKKKKPQHTGPRHECEHVANQGEEEENGQVKESAEYHVPESSNEAHCLADIQKTATDDKSATHF